MKALFTALIILQLLLYPQSVEARLKNIREFDSLIEEATKRYWPDFNIPELLKAQLYQESRLDPKAISPVGAMGIAQFMPATWGDMVKALALPAEASPHNVRFAIRAAAYYMAQLRNHKLWKDIKPKDRHTLAMASYNAGLGNIQKACRFFNTVLAVGCLEALPKITGRKHSLETQTYVKRIWKYADELIKDSSNEKSVLLYKFLKLGE
jgi:soluble lytic murein transglycosylase-like protein